MSTGRSDALELAELPWPIELVPHASARSIRLRLDERRERLLLTYPRRMSQRRVLDWARQQSEWATAQVSKLEPAISIRDGATIPVRGEPCLLQWEPDAPRVPRLAGGRIVAGGPRESFGGRIERYLKEQARLVLSERTAAHAAVAGVSVRSVSIGDAGRRWGSCSASGAIRYNWRLFLAPPHILDWVCAHEVAHRIHMNHGPEFRALERQLFGGNVAAARAELARLGPGLKRIAVTV